MASKAQLLRWVGSTNAVGLGYTPESADEMEMLALMAQSGEVKEISFHDGYQLLGYDIPPKPRPLTPEQLAHKVLDAHLANSYDEADVLRLLVEVATQARAGHVSIS